MSTDIATGLGHAERYEYIRARVKGRKGSTWTPRPPELLPRVVVIINRDMALTLGMFHWAKVDAHKIHLPDPAYRHVNWMDYDLGQLPPN